MNIDDLKEGEFEVIEEQSKEPQITNIDQLDESQIEVIPPTPTFESALRGAAQGVTLGFADEISGAVESAFTDKTYEQAREESRQAFDKAKEDNPIAFAGAEVVGGVASAIAAGPAAISTRGAIAFGAIQGLGDSEEDEIEGQLLDTLVGGALGAAGDKAFGLAGNLGGKVFGKAGSALKGTAGRLQDSIRHQADLLGFKGLGISNKSHVKKLTRKVESKGQKLDDFMDTFNAEVDINGESLVGKGFKSQEELLTDLVDRKDQLGTEIGAILKKIDVDNEGSIALDPNELADDLFLNVIEPLTNGASTLGEQQVAQKLLKQTEFIRNQKNWSMTDLHNWKVKLGKQIRFATKENTDLALNSKMKDILSKTNDFIHDKVRVHSNDIDTLDLFKQTKKRFGTLADAEEFIADSVSAGKQGFLGNVRRTFSMFGGGGATLAGGYVGGIPGAAIGGALELASRSPQINRALSGKLKQISEFTLKTPEDPSLGKYFKMLSDSSIRGNEAFEEAIDLIHRNINGEIIDEEERQGYLQQVDASGLPTRSRMRLKSTINNENRIPDFEAESQEPSNQPFIKQIPKVVRDNKGKKEDDSILVTADGPVTPVEGF